MDRSTRRKKRQQDKQRQQANQTSQALTVESTGALASGERWFILGLILLFVIIVRVRLLDIPLERDEGEYAYMGQMLLHGIAPFSAVYNMKLPGTSIMYAGIMMIFGQSVKGIHLGFMFLNCATILLMFYFCKKLVNDFTGIIASGFYAVLSLSITVYGFAAHATHFVILPAIGGALLLLFALEKGRPYIYFLSGTVFGLAFVMKQPGIFFSFFGVFQILYHYWFSKPRQFIKTLLLNLTLFISGALLPFLIIILWLYASGVFDKFWFWTVQYAAAYVNRLSFSQGIAFFKENSLQVIDGFFLIWIFAALGFVVLFIHRKLNVDRMFIIFFAAFSFLTICPGLYFREHYFITLLPSISIAAAIFINYCTAKVIEYFKSNLLRFAGLGIFVAAVLVGIIMQEEYLFEQDPDTLSRTMYRMNPFSESPVIAKYMEDRSNNTEKIAVLGSEPQIFFYSKRRSATGFIYTYALSEKHDYALTMQKEMIREIEVASPKFIVFVRIFSSWMGSPNDLLTWLNGYVQNNYHLVGIADIMRPEPTIYKWDDDVKTYSIRGQDHILIYEKNKSG